MFVQHPRAAILKSGTAALAAALGRVLSRQPGQSEPGEPEAPGGQISGPGDGQAENENGSKNVPREAMYRSGTK